MILLLGLTIGAIFVFRLSLQEALVDVDIEELARYSAPKTTENSPEPAKTLAQTTKTTVPAQEVTPPTSHETETTPAFAQETIETTKKEINVPPPLTHQSPTPIGTLTVSGVLARTNAERKAQSQGDLALNAKLTTAATAKLQDMFAKQYFAHVSPQGKEPSDWVDEAGYTYKLTGENLALGDFSSDADLVAAWMNSPGHRANILKPEYTEIGVAVGKGMFEGREMWLAVQVFGHPMPVCPLPSEQTKQNITTNQNTLKQLQTQLTDKKQELDTYEPKNGDIYKQKVDAYNVLIAEYNALIGTTEQLVNQYNVDINTYNTCIANG